MDTGMDTENTTTHLETAGELGVVTGMGMGLETAKETVKDKTKMEFGFLREGVGRVTRKVGDETLLGTWNTIFIGAKVLHDN
jgi:hypothetical protein